MKSRITLVFILFASLWVLVIARAAYLQIIPNQRLAQLQRRQFETTVTLQSRRGAIYDQSGQDLAVSIRSYSLFADPKLVEQPRATAHKLASLLGLSTESIYKKIAPAHDKRFVWIHRHMDNDVKDQIANLKLKGFGFVQESKRVYPNGSLLANTLGFVGQDGQGLEGVEAQFDEQLRNRKRQVSLPRDARGRPLIVNGQYFAENLDGSDVDLTIDQELEFVLERELARAAREHQADAAVGVIMDVKSSEIRAMAQVPTFDPNSPLASNSDSRRNRVITDAFEPGSVMKTIIAAGALADKKIQPNSKFDCEGGQFKIGGKIIREAEAHEKYHLLSVSEILAFSSNVGAAKLALSYGQQGVYETLRKFGFGERTGIDLVGEAKGVLHPLPWRSLNFANIGFGQGMTATPLQIANAYTAIANGGMLRAPILVKSIRDIETGDIRHFKTHDIRRVMSREEAEQVTLMLTTVTGRGGTGFNARVAGYPVAGKTGTAQKVRADGRGYMSKGYISSFAGYVPASDPQFVIYIAIDNPKKDYYAATSAAPVFSRVASFALRKASIPPVYISETNLMPAATAAPSEATHLTLSERAHADLRTLAATRATQLQVLTNPLEMDGIHAPNLVGLSLREVFRKVHNSHLEIHSVGEGWVVRTEPAANEVLPSDHRLTVYLERRD